ncbi:MAG: penicillin-binding protein 1C [Candidatus Hydrogenedentes bacterium]|nr:penicillin-binding protein 1C [Candidatus Hydrogenedentota bacterium]
MARRWLRRRTSIVLAAGLLLAAGGAALVLWPLDPAPYLHVPSSGELQDREGRLLYAYLRADDAWCFPRPLAELGPVLAQATIAAEDQRFYTHQGVDPAAVLRAFWQNFRHVEVRSGASTLTMQVIKLANPGPRSLPSKAWQALQALRLERQTSKAALLEAYLNGAPYGMNLVGAEAAARRYFGKRAKELTLPEAALLAGLPKGPSARQPLRYPKRALERRDYVLGRMLAEGFINTADHDRAVATPLGAAWHDYPRNAPHLAQQFRRQAEREGVVHSTLDLPLQRATEALLAEYLKKFEGEIGNGAVIVADVAAGVERVRVGSADFFAAKGGQVDALRAARSPGSALKPFTYALAMDRNVLYASESLSDGVLDYGLYQPGNFDGRYRGLIPAGSALRHSLNVPAVLLLERVGVESLQDFLKRAGLRTLNRSAAAYGLGLTLGNCEVRLEELAAAYAMVARLGEYRPLSAVHAASTEGVRLLSRGVCLKLYEMMEQPLPEEFDQRYLPSVNARPRVCWKTGTSTGLHDAWAFVFNQQYVVGVWMGNNDGAYSPKLVGALAALPLAAAVFQSLPPLPAPAWPEADDALVDVKICAVTGLPVSAWCAQTRTARLPREQYLHRTCDVHSPSPVVTSKPGGPVVERWPGNVKGWDLAKVIAPITQGVEEAAVQRATQLSLLNPADGAEFVLTGEERGDRLRLQSSVDAEQTVHWYLDGKYLGAAPPGAPLFLDLTEGEHQVTCMTHDGKQETVKYSVSLPRRVFR